MGSLSLNSHFVSVDGADRAAAGRPGVRRALPAAEHPVPEQQEPDDGGHQVGRDQDRDLSQPPGMAQCG